MEPSWEPARAAGEVWADVLVPVAREMEAGAADVSLAAVARIREQVPALFGDRESEEENRASTEAGVRTFAALVHAGADPAGSRLPDATVAYAQAAVRRGVPLNLLMRSYRLAVSVAWQAMFERLAAHTRDHAQLEAAGQLGAAWLFAYVDVAMSAAEQLYDEERTRWVRSAAASQAETIEALLSGREKDAGRASMRLRYELERHHLAAIAWLDDADGADSLTQLDAAARALAATAGADSVLVHPLGLFAVAAWLGRIAPFEALGELRPPPGVFVALGEPASGIAGFRASHEQAGHARRVASLAGRRSITRFRAVALVALATADVDQARAFVHAELGALAEDDDVARRLAATLRVYLDENASRSRAAKRLSIHENTVSYRVRQTEELLGRSVEERTLELRVALALLAAMG